MNPFSMLQTLGVAAIACVLAFGAGFWRGDIHGEKSKQAEWNEERLKLAQAVDDANLRANQSAVRFEEWKSRQEPKRIYVTRKVQDAIASAPDWASQRLPDGVRDAVAAAASAIDSRQPDNSLPKAPGRPADERPATGGIRSSSGFLGRLFRPASSPG